MADRRALAERPIRQHPSQDWREGRLMELDEEERESFRFFAEEDEVLKTPRDALAGRTMKALERRGILTSRTYGRWAYVELTCYGRQLWSFIYQHRRWDLMLSRLSFGSSPADARREVNLVYPPRRGPRG